MSEPETTGQRIARLRRAHRRTAWAVAAVAGIPEFRLAQIEAGLGEPVQRRAELEPLARALSVDTRVLLGLPIEADDLPEAT